MATDARPLTARLPAPTWRLGALAAAVSPLAWALPLSPLAAPGLLSGLVLALAALDVALAPAPARLAVERELPGAVSLDGEGVVRWRVANPTGRRLRVALADDLAPSLGAQTRRARLVVPPRGRASRATTIRPTRRGRFRPETVTLRVEGPLRLAARQDVLAVPGSLRVLPRFRSREEAELRLDRAQVLQAGLRLAQGQGGGTEFDRLREYEVDDEFRHIDWAATARSGKAIVRTYRAERNQTVLVLLDSGRTMAGQVALEGGRARSGYADASWTVPRLDHAMDAAMALTVVATRLGDATGLVAFADGVRAVVPPRGKPTQLGRITEALAPLEPVLAESDYRQAFGETLTRFRRRALLVVLTELSPEPMDETLLPALPLVLRDHLVIVAGIRDPEVDRWARGVPEDAEAAYRKASAAAALERRAQAAARLRGLGATVIDEPPARLPGALADAYLDVKATGRL